MRYRDETEHPITTPCVAANKLTMYDNEASCFGCSSQNKNKPLDIITADLDFLPEKIRNITMQSFFASIDKY